jgi:hypothetical protein
MINDLWLLITEDAVLGCREAMPLPPFGTSLATGRSSLRVVPKYMADALAARQLHPNKTLGILGLPGWTGHL